MVVERVGWNVSDLVKFVTPDERRESKKELRVPGVATLVSYLLLSRQEAALVSSRRQRNC